MSRHGFATDKEIKKNFDEALTAAIDLGQWPPSDQGFDNYVDDALRQLAKSYPQIQPALIAGAQLALAGQLDGTNAARRRAELDALLGR